MTDRLTNEELAALHNAGDFAALMRAALRHVPHAMRALRQRGALFPDNINPDLIQDAALAACEAVRDWSPIEYAFSTHIETRVRSAVLNAMLGGLTGGIGSRRTVLAGATAQHTSLNVENPATHDEAHAEQVQDALTYAELGDVPEGLDQPEAELARAYAAETAEALMAELSLEDRALIRARYQHEATFRDYAALTGQGVGTLHRRATRVLRKLEQRAKTCVKDSTAAPDWKGVRSHYPAAEMHPGFWGGGGPSRGMIEGNPTWAEHAGVVWNNWSWKPSPEDVAEYRRGEKIFNRQRATQRRVS